MPQQAHRGFETSLHEIHNANNVYCKSEQHLEALLVFYKESPLVSYMV